MTLEWLRVIFVVVTFAVLALLLRHEWTHRRPQERVLRQWP